MEAQNVDSSWYDTQALRLEDRRGKRLLVRGRDGTLVGNIGARGFDLPAALAPSPEAMQEAAEYKRTHNRGSNILAAGILLWGVGAGLTRMDNVDMFVTVPAWTAVAVGTGLIYYGGLELNKAFTALGRSIWWYNRQLGREQDVPRKDVR